MPAPQSKHTVYLPVDFVRELQRRALEGAAGGSSYGAVQAFLRRAVKNAIAEYHRQSGRTAPLLARGTWVEVPAAEAAFFEQLTRYLAAPASPSEQEWKEALRRAVAAWGEGRKA
jgi:hypothetical protein